MADKTDTERRSLISVEYELVQSFGKTSFIKAKVELAYVEHATLFIIHDGGNEEVHAPGSWRSLYKTDKR